MSDTQTTTLEPTTTETKTPEPKGPVGRTKTGKFPTKELEKLRLTNGYLRITTRDETIPNPKDATKVKKVHRYDITAHRPNQAPEVVAVDLEGFTEAKQTARDTAVEMQLAFFVPTDYDRFRSA
jgi:hypothetical protein